MSKPATTVQDCVATFRCGKLPDVFNETSSKLKHGLPLTLTRGVVGTKPNQNHRLGVVTTYSWSAAANFYPARWIVGRDHKAFLLK